MRMPPSARPHAGRNASRAAGALALALAVCLASAPIASADAYFVGGDALAASLNVYSQAQNQSIVAASPTLSQPYQTTVTPLASTVADVGSPGLLSTGQLSASITGPGSGGVIDISASASDVVVPGVLTADAVKSHCTASQSGGAGAASFENLVVAGVHMPDDPAPNTEVDIPGGEVVLNQQTFATSGIRATMVAINIGFLPSAAQGVGYILIDESNCLAAATANLPVGAVGGVLLSGVLGVLFTVRQLCRRPA